MREFLSWFWQQLGNIISVVDTNDILAGASIWDIFIGFIVLGMVISVFWKGAKG